MTKFLTWQRSKTGFFFGVLLCATFVASPVLAESETPLETLAWCESLAFGASEMAFKAQVICDYHTAHQALNLADEAAFLLSTVGTVAQDTADSQLALSAYNVSNEVEAAIANILRTAKHIASRSQNPDEVHAANFLLDSCEVAQKSNRVTMDTALMAFSGNSERTEAYSK